MGAGKNWRSVTRLVLRALKDRVGEQEANRWAAVLVDLPSHAGSLHSEVRPVSVKSCAAKLNSLLSEIEIGGTAGLHALDVPAGTALHRPQSAVPPSAVRLDEASLPALPPTPINVVIGHSMGGKVILLSQGGPSTATRTSSSSQSEQHRRRRLVVLDTYPGRWRTHPSQSQGTPTGDTLVTPQKARRDQDGVQVVLEAVRAAPVPFPSRRAAGEYFSQLGFSKSLSQWMTTNVTEAACDERGVPLSGSGPADQGGSEEGGFVWTFDPVEALNAYHDLADIDSWELLRNPPRGAAIDFVLGTRGARWGVSKVVARLQGVLEAQDARRRDGPSGSACLLSPASPVPLPRALDPSGLSLGHARAGATAPNAVSGSGGGGGGGGSAVSVLNEAPVESF